MPFRAPSLRSSPSFELADRQRFARQLHEDLLERVVVRGRAHGALLLSQRVEAVLDARLVAIERRELRVSGAAVGARHGSASVEEETTRQRPLRARVRLGSAPLLALVLELRMFRLQL